jgi:RimJ/RimL family protein N-acetyltransferase
VEPVILRTRRLVLSIPTRADADAITIACQDPEIQRFTTVPRPYVREHAEKFIDLAPRQWAEGVSTNWAIRHNGALAGMIGMHRLGAEKGSGEIGYWMTGSSRGKGLLTEAATAVLDFAFAPQGLDLVRVEWRAVVGNVASAASARALGFRYEGLLRQALVSPGGRDDGWVAGLLRRDDRTPQPWSVLET